jgi:hypothetical protein
VQKGLEAWLKQKSACLKKKKKKEENPANIPGKLG